jgi:general secretion pathway protein C
LPKHLANKINKVGENEYRVERSALNEIMEKQTQLMGRTRVRPYKRGGKIVGVRLSRVRSGTLLHTLGLKSGDVLKSINGFDMTNPQKALEAYGRLGNADNLKVQIERGRKPMTIDFHIQ